MDKKIIFVEGKNQTQVFLGECCEIVKNNVFYTANLVATFALAIWLVFIFSKGMGVKGLDFFKTSIAWGKCPIDVCRFISSTWFTSSISEMQYAIL